MSTGKRIVMIAVAVFLVLLIIGPWIAPQDPNLTATADKLQGPSAAHWFGTDDLGRDVFSRILTGGLNTVGLSALRPAAAARTAARMSSRGESLSR